MVKSKSGLQHGNRALQNSNVSDQVVSQVGEATMEILRLRQTLEEDMATAETEKKRETLAMQVQSAAIRAIDERAGPDCRRV